MCDSDATSASDGRRAPATQRLLHYDLTAAASFVKELPSSLSGEYSVLRAALRGKVVPFADGLLLGAHLHGDGALLQFTLYCADCAEHLVGAVVARRTTDRTITAWRQLRADAPAVMRHHLLPQAPAVAPWVISETLPDALPRHDCCEAWLQETVRMLALTWLSWR